MQDFESTPEYQALVVAAAGKPERSMGESVIPAEPPNWKEVRQLARALLDAAPMQMPVHIHLVKADSAVGGMPAFAAALAELRATLQAHWDDIQPPADPDDPDDPYYERVNLMRELAEHRGFLDSVVRLPLVSARGIGAFSSRDIAIGSGEIAGSEEEQQRCQEGLIRGAFAEAESDALQAMADALGELARDIAGLESLFAERSGQRDVLSMDLLRDAIAEARERFDVYAGDRLQASAPEPAADEPVASNDEVSSSAVTSSGTTLPTSTLTGRQDVLDGFDAILRYYQAREPASPVRIFVYRARGMVDMGFFELLAELAPGQRDDLPSLLRALQRQPLSSLLLDSYQRFAAGEPMPPTPSAVAADDSSGYGTDVDTSPGGPDAVNIHADSLPDSREAVVALLQDIEAYYLRHEPASPVPLVIGEIRRLVGRRFIDLVTEFGRSLPVADAAEAAE